MKLVRRSLVFLLGLVLIYDSITHDQFRVLEFATGCIMVGLFPFDYIVDVITRPARDEAEMERLKEVLKKKEDE